MRLNRTSTTTRLLKLLIGAALILPAALFLSLAYTNYRALQKVAGERIERTLDVVQEHTLRVFETIDRTIAETNEVLRHDSDEAIREREQSFHQRLRETQLSLPQIEAIWAFDRTGRPLVSSTIYPLPATLNNADRDYFRAHAERDAGTYIGDVIQARIGGATFFVVSRRRSPADGAFNGIIAVTVPPKSISEFYARIAEGTALSVGLIRADGTFLARYPVGTLPIARLGPGNRFVEAIAREPQRGSYFAVSQIDGVGRQIAYRKMPGFDVYVQAGYRTDAIWSEL